MVMGVSEQVDQVARGDQVTGMNLGGARERGSRCELLIRASGEGCLLELKGS